MYIQGFVLAVPAANKQAYHDTARRFAEYVKDFGVLEIVEAWEDDVKDGKHTDFRRAVKLEEGEKVVFSWVIWPDKATAEAASARMMSDPAMEEMGKTMPFDGKRMIFGGFEPLFTLGRD